MVEFFVQSNDDIQRVAALQPQAAEGVLIIVTGVNSLESALEMRHSLLLGVIDLDWACPGLRRLTDIACLAAELRDVRDRLIPLVLANPNPFNDILKLKNSGWLVRFLGRADYGNGQPQQTPLWAAATRLSNRILRIARRYIEGNQEVDWVRERMPDLAQRITASLQEVAVDLPQLQEEEDDD